MTLKPPKNPNYCATVVRLSSFVDLPNCDKVKAAIVWGNSVIVSKDAQAGDLGLYFPPETALSAEFLAANNLYRKPEWGNVDPEKSGYFEQHGRVRAVKFRGHKSEGFWIPLSCLDYLEEPEIPEGVSFDAIGDAKICHKYVAKGNRRVGAGRNSPKTKNVLIDGQFRFHADTENLRKNYHKVKPDDFISISDKWHGTSAVFANVLVSRNLSWWEKALKRLGVQIPDKEYSLVWSSRRVVKGVGVSKNTQGFHGNIWDTVANEVKDLIPQGFTLYGEIVGYDDEGKQIQKDYTYGCVPGTHRFVVYRVTYTNPSGLVIELPYTQMEQFCDKYGLSHVVTLWKGYASHIVRTMLGNVDTPDFGEAFLEAVEKGFVQGKPCPFNGNKVPAEGVVVRIDRLQEAEAYKCKNFAFLERETKLLDAGESDIETEESLDFAD